MAITRVIDFVEHNLVSLQVSAVVVPSTTAVTVIPDSTAQGHADSEKYDPTGRVTQSIDAFAKSYLDNEVAYIEIFNVGPGNAYVAFGRDADSATNFNAYLAPGQMYEIKTREKISVYASGGACTIARNIIIRATAPDNLS